MKSIREYHWQGQSIKIETHSSAKFLWLDRKLEVSINNKKVKQVKTQSLTQSSTKFSVPYEGHNLKGQIISKGLPFTPVLSQSIIIDDTIIEKSSLLSGKHALTHTSVINF